MSFRQNSKKALLGLSFLVVFIFSACSVQAPSKGGSVIGSFDKSIDSAVRQIKNNSNSARGKQAVSVLSESYTNALEKDQSILQSIGDKTDQQSLKTLYEVYSRIEQRKRKVESILPLTDENGQSVSFESPDFSKESTMVYEKLSHQIYSDAETVIAGTDKMSIRQAYESLQYLDKINPGYKSLQSLMFEAQQKGRVNLLLDVDNRTFNILPRAIVYDIAEKLENRKDLKDWLIVDESPRRDTNYDYVLEVDLERVNVYPEEIRERTENKQRTVGTGTVNYDITTIEVRKRAYMAGRFRLFNEYGNLVYKDRVYESENYRDRYGTTNVSNTNWLSKSDRRLVRDRPGLIPSDRTMIRRVSGDFAREIGWDIVSYFKKNK